MLKEFREFIARGNVVDMAVGIIMGVAFTAIVTSLVQDVVMPPVGVLVGGADFSQFYLNLSGGSYASLAEAEEAGAATLTYGRFVNAVINFLLVAFVVFLLVRAVNRLKRRQEEAPAAAPPPPRSEQLLEEIRDLLKQR
jgi:large conductance mechanosensitive channel